MVIWCLIGSHDSHFPYFLTEEDRLSVKDGTPSCPLHLILWLRRNGFLGTKSAIRHGPDQREGGRMGNTHRSAVSARLTGRKVGKGPSP